MKLFAVTASVLVLALTGVVGSTRTSDALSKGEQIAPVVVGTTGPAPMCMPHDPTHCGMD